MIKYKLLRRKQKVYGVTFEDRFGIVEKLGSHKWRLREVDKEAVVCRSRRAAFYYFEYGKPFKTNPVYATRAGKSTGKRIR